MTPKGCAAVVSLLGAAWGCAANEEPTSSLTSISPSVAYNDVPLDVKIGGSVFRPAYDFDTMAGATEAEAGSFAVTLRSVAGPSQPSHVVVPLADVTWKKITELEATVPAGVQAGDYDVVVTNPRGQSVALPQAFRSLGPDEAPPAVTITSPKPRGIVGANTTIQIVVSAHDGHGAVESIEIEAWTAATEPRRRVCMVTPPTATATCVLADFAVPPPEEGVDDALQVRVIARDSAGNETAPDAARFPLVPHPALIRMTPTVGPVGGGTEIIVQGTNFVLPTAESDGSDLLIDGQPVPIVAITPTEIKAVTGPHSPGLAMVAVANGTARSAPRLFEFVAAPRVFLISPTRGPVTGGTWIAISGKYFREGVTSFFVGREPLIDLCFVSSVRVEGRVPPGDSTGSVEIKAHDPIGGSGELADAFLYELPDPPQTDPPPLDPSPPGPDADLEPMLCPGVIP